MNASELPDPTHLGTGPAKLVGVGIASLTVAWISVLLRVWARSIITRSFGWDDWTILLTMVSFTVQCAYIVKLGFREMHPEDNTNLPAISSLVTDVIALAGAFVLTSIFLKISLALFFLRIIIKPWQRRLILISLIIYTLFAFSYFGVAAFGCGNPANFLANTAQGKCVSVPAVTIPMSYVQTSLNAAIDWLFVILPIHTLWTLNMPRAIKLWTSALIVMGALGSIASLIRLATVQGLNPGHDFFRASTPTAVWATIEPGLGIAAASFATLRPMFRRCIESTRIGYSRDQTAVVTDVVPPITTTGLGEGSRGDLSAGKRASLSPKSAAERAGFRPFGSLDEDVELASVQQWRFDGEKAVFGSCGRQNHGNWVQCTAATDKR